MTPTDRKRDLYSSHRILASVSLPDDHDREITITTTMTADVMRAIICLGLMRDVADWANGKNASPSGLDFVVTARELMQAHWPTFIGTTPEGEQFNADVLDEDCGEKYSTPWDVAEFLFDTLTAE